MCVLYARARACVWEILLSIHHHDNDIDKHTNTTIAHNRSSVNINMSNTTNVCMRVGGQHGLPAAEPEEGKGARSHSGHDSDNGHATTTNPTNTTNTNNSNNTTTNNNDHDSNDNDNNDSDRTNNTNTNKHNDYDDDDNNDNTSPACCCLVCMLHRTARTPPQNRRVL